jgi:hypothetical protein
MENLRGDWSISDASDEYVKKDASTIEFKVKDPMGRKR